MLRSVTIYLLTTIILMALLGGCGGRRDPEVELAGISTIDYLDGLMKGVSRALNGVNNIETAYAAAPKLEQLATDYDDLIFHAEKLSLDGRSKLAKEAYKYWPELQRMADMIQTSPALQPILGQPMQNLLDRHQRVMTTIEVVPTDA